MGVFSWCCNSCGHPALCRTACDPEINLWMSSVVALCKKGPFSEGGMHAGEYDGYGRVGGAELHEVGSAGFSLFHRSCWELRGQPLEFTWQSTSAVDQGWFFEDGAHDLLDPKTTQFQAPEVVAERLARAVAARDGRKRGHAFFDADQKADKGTYRELYRIEVLEPAEKMTVEERIAQWGYDPIQSFQEFGYLDD